MKYTIEIEHKGTKTRATVEFGDAHAGLHWGKISLFAAQLYGGVVQNDEYLDDSGNWAPLTPDVVERMRDETGIDPSAAETMYRLI